MYLKITAYFLLEKYRPNYKATRRNIRKATNITNFGTSDSMTNKWKNIFQKI